VSEGDAGELKAGESGGEDLWVFGYGSLMWRPGFPYEEVVPALLRGYHRAFCIYSHYYRGTLQRPGLVLGLGLGGACRGLAFRVLAAHAAATIDYLTERELGSYAYLARTLPLSLARGEDIEALVFVSNTEHHGYAGTLPVERQAELIIEAEGCAGLNRDYLINTVRELEAHGFVEPPLHELLREVSYQTGLIEAGGGI